MLHDIPKCKNFSGYKPCFSDHNCWTDGCKEEKSIGKKILIINLDAMGDVLMTTAQLPGIKRKFPVSTIYWITLKNAAGLLENNPYLDKVFVYDFESLAILNQMEFDYVMNVDKSRRSSALLTSLKAAHKLGFGLNPDGKIYPVNEGAYYNYNLGMDDHLKFRINKRTGQDYLAETFELDYRRDEYVFNFSEAEKKFIENFREKSGIKKNDLVVGLNTGCSTLFPNKKMTIDQHIYLINKLLGYPGIKIILLGGPEDLDRNNEIASHFSEQIINTPVSGGVRKGACYEEIADIVITGDSFGMHLAIALKKYVIAWFGLSCWTEIDLYDRGIKLFNEKLECSPCWKKSCPFNLECISSIDLERIASTVLQIYEKRSASVFSE
jgi:ADP-heptose:LPS heptosyltransferase